MSYDLIPVKKDVESFRMGAFSFPLLLEQCGYLWPCIQGHGQWFCAFGVDPRMGDSYPMIISNDGFRVTAFEAKVMARCARNFVAIQRLLPDENKGEEISSQASFNKEDVTRMLLKSLSGNYSREPWPKKIREDFTKKFEEFADWAEKSRGFRIY